MRLFVAAELPDTLLDALAETSAALRSEVSGRYVGPDLFHVTLAFLGDVPAAQADEVLACMAQACACQPAFQTSLGALGTFGRPSSAVLWQGFSSGRKEWSALATSVRSSLAAAGIRYDGTGFVPHVTLMRRANVSSGRLPMPYLAKGTIQTVTLFCSDLSGARPRYEALGRLELGTSETMASPQSYADDLC